MESFHALNKIISGGRGQRPK